MESGQAGSELSSSEEPGAGLTGDRPSAQPRARLLTCALSLCGGLGRSPPILGQSRGTPAPPLSSISCYGERQVPRTWETGHMGVWALPTLQQGAWASQVTGSLDQALSRRHHRALK